MAEMIDGLPPVTLLVVDDQLLYREALCGLIGHWPEFDLVGDVPSGEEAIAFCAKREPQMILMDVQMPGMDGVQTAGIISATHPHTRIVMLTVTPDDGYLFGAIRNGACGYILKDTPARQLRNRLQGVIRGEGALSGVVAKKVIDRLNASPAEPLAQEGAFPVPRPELSEREVQIVRLVAEGLSNEEIGARLYISPATVKKQLSQILKKLYVDNRVQLAVYAAKVGIL